MNQLVLSKARQIVSPLAMQTYNALKQEQRRRVGADYYAVINGEWRKVKLFVAKPIKV